MEEEIEQKEALVLQSFANCNEEIRKHWENIRSRWMCPICGKKKKASEVTAMDCCHQLVCTNCIANNLSNSRENDVEIKCMFCRDPTREQYFDTLSSPFLVVSAENESGQDAANTVALRSQRMMHRVRAYVNGIIRTGLQEKTAEKLWSDVWRHKWTQIRRTASALSYVDVVYMGWDDSTLEEAWLMDRRGPP